MSEFPSRVHGRRRDRRGRGLRGPLVAPIVPTWRSRRDKFDDLVSAEAAHLIMHEPRLANVEFGVEDVPPSDPAPWERQQVALGRAFAADRALHLKDRIVVYRRPIQARARTSHDLAHLVHHVLVQEASALLGLEPWQIDPHFPR